MSGKERLRRALNKRLSAKADKPPLIPGLLGAFVGNKWVISVSGRPSFVYVRVHGNNSEIVEAFNDTVALTMGLSVVLTRDELTPTYYRILRRDITKYPTTEWKGGAQLGYHAIQHEFGGSGSMGADIVWVQKQQFVPLEVRPLSATGSYQCYVDPEYYQWNADYKFFSGSATPDFSILRPDGSLQGLFTLVYLDGATDSLKVLTGTSFAHTPWPPNYRTLIPTIPASQGIPLAGILLTHEMTDVNWNQIYDLRPIIGNGGITGSSGGGGSSITGSTYALVTPDAQLPNARQLAAGAGLLLTDSGAGGNLTYSITGSLMPDLSICEKIYYVMPTAAQLKADMDADYASGIVRRYVLPAGNFIVPSDFIFNPGQGIFGQRSEYYCSGTVIILASAASMVMNFQTELGRVTINPDSAAAVPAIYAHGSPTDRGAHFITLRDLQFIGGNSATWCVHLQNAYEWYFENIKATSQSSGILLDVTPDHPYNPGDGVAIKVQIRLQAANTIGVKIVGQMTGGTYHNRHPNDQTWIGLYISGADNLLWATSNMKGVEIINTSRLHFYGANLEENYVDVELSGGVTGGPSCSAICFGSSWLGDSLVVNSGVYDVELPGTLLSGNITGTNVANINLTGQITAGGSALPLTMSPHYRGSFQTKTISNEVYGANGSSSDLIGNRILKWTPAGDLDLMTSADNSSVLAGISVAPILSGTSGYVCVYGNNVVRCVGVVNIGDYLGIDPSNPGYVRSFGTVPDTTGTMVGYAVTSGTATTIVMHLRPTTSPFIYVPEDIANKSNDPTFASDSAMQYPTVHAVKTLFGTINSGPLSSLPGYWFSSGLTWTTSTMSLNQLNAAPIQLTSQKVFNKIAIEITTGSTSSVIRLGIYNDNGYGYPGVLSLEAGTVDATGTAIKTINIAWTGSIGTYWLGAVAQGGTPTVRVINSPSIPIGYSALGSAAHSGYAQGSVSGALPTTFSTSGSSNGGIPRVGICAT